MKAAGSAGMMLKIPASWQIIEIALELCRIIVQFDTCQIAHFLVSYFRSILAI